MELMTEDQENKTKELLIGRERELEQLNAVFQNLHQKKSGMVMIQGEAGVGKTVLVETSLTENKIKVFSGCASENVTPAYGPITRALRTCMRQSPGRSVDCGPFTAYLSLLLPELGTPPPQVDHNTLVEAISTALLNMAKEQPCVLLLEDIHWADNATIELLPILVDRVKHESFLVLGTCRNSQQGNRRLRWLKDQLRRRKQLKEISVQPLDRYQSELLLTHTLKTKPAPSLADLVFSRTHGLPLYVQELTVALDKGRYLKTSNSGMELIPGKEIPVPDSIRDAVLLRVEDLSPPARKKLEAAAAAGNIFQLDLLLRLTPDEAGLDELFQHRFIREKGSGYGEFSHALVRDAVYSEILWPRRRTLNREIALYLETNNGLNDAESIAGHWLEADEKEKARSAFYAAALNSSRLYAYRDAVTSAKRAMEIWPPNTLQKDYLELLDLISHCAQMSGQLKEAASSLEQMKVSPVLSKDPFRLAGTLRSLATVYGLQGDWEQFLKTRKSSAVVFEESGYSGEAAVELLALGGRYTAMGNLDTALQTVRRAATLAQSAKRYDIQARAMGLEGNQLAMKGEFQAGQTRAKEALALALEHNLSDAAAEVYRRVASSFEHASNYSGALEAYNTALNYCKAQGEEVYAQVCLGCMSGVLFQAGDWKRTVEVCKEVINRDFSPSGSRTVAVGILGLVRTLRGETREARNLLTNSLNMSQSLEIAAMELLNLWGLGMLEEHEEHLDKAEDYYLRLLNRWETTQDLHDAIPALSWAATFFSKRGNLKETTMCAEALATIASATGNPEAIAALSYALGETDLLNTIPEEAAQQFVQTLDYLARTDVPLERVMAEFRAGIAFVRAGNRDVGVGHLTHAYGIARKLGTRPLAGAIRNELETMGELTVETRNPKTGARAKRKGLTRRQLEILRLIASGMTDRMMAGKLFLSPRTVEMHVFNILNRLDCRNRSEAVRKAGELGLLE